MAADLSRWLPVDPETADGARWLIQSLAEKLTGLSASLSDDEAIVMAVRMWNAFRLVDLPRELARLKDERLRDQPEPPGVDWACETGERAADVVEACRQIVKTKTGLHGRNWPDKVSEFVPREHRWSNPRLTPRTWNRWRRGEQAVDREAVIAALKIALVEDAHELQLAKARP